MKNLLKYSLEGRYKMKKVGIITFHNSYNCGSMLETYAMQEIIKKGGLNPEIVNFSSPGQISLYTAWFKNNSVKNIVKNILISPYIEHIKSNNEKYIEFQKKYFYLSKFIMDSSNLKDEEYDTVISGSDQIWNITIDDYDDAYFLNWVKNAKRVAYSPSFGSKNILKYSDKPKKYKKLILDYDAVSVREKNGKKWIKDLTGLDVPVLLDPTLLLEREDYEKLISEDILENEDYIFFYSPGFNNDICKYVKEVANKYNMKVVTWSSKQYYVKNIKKYGFELPEYENPEMYLYLIKNAKLIFTTSYHGTIFSTIFRKKFYTIRNGGMYGEDDRVITLLEQINLMDRLIPYEFDDKFDYMSQPNFIDSDKKLLKLKEKSIKFLNDNVRGFNYETRK